MLEPENISKRVVALIISVAIAIILLSNASTPVFNSSLPTTISGIVAGFTNMFYYVLIVELLSPVVDILLKLAEKLTNDYFY